MTSINIFNTCLVKIPNLSGGNSYQFTFDSSQEIGNIPLSEILFKMAEAHKRDFEAKDG